MKDILRKWRVVLLVITGVVVITVGVLLLLLFVHKPASTTASSVQTSVQQTVAALPHNERQVVTSYNQAAIKQDWQTLYNATSKMVVGGYTQDQFTQQMNQQVQENGTISSIVVNSISQVTTNESGLPYFMVLEDVTMTKNGISQKQSLISVYILEDGAWKFWFSKPSA